MGKTNNKNQKTRKTKKNLQDDLQNKSGSSPLIKIIILRTPYNDGKQV